MGLFDAFKKKSSLTITIKSPASVTTEDLAIDLELTFLSPTATTVDNLQVRLRGDLVDRKQAPSAAPYHYLGETVYPQPIKMAPNKPEDITIKLPLDFSTLESYEIPPENLAVASEEMRAAAAAAKSATYSYTIEVVAKTAGSDTETASRTPIQLIDPNTVRSSSF